MPLRVCFSGDGQGEIAAAIRRKLESDSVQDECEFIPDTLHALCDVAICTTGGMLIRQASEVTVGELQRLYDGNYRMPREFTEGHIVRMRAHRIKGQIIHLGSNASWYGNVGADDYAAYKTALRKYLELRGRDVRQYGIRICHLAFGGVATAFWDKATAGADPELAKTIVAGTRQMLTADEAAAVVVAAITLPENVVLRDCLIVSRDYQ